MNNTKKISFFSVLILSMISLSGCARFGQTKTSEIKNNANTIVDQNIQPIIDKTGTTTATQTTEIKPQIQKPDNQPTKKPVVQPAKIIKPTAPTRIYITIKDFAFSPAALTIKAGTTVIWINQDAVPHTATSQNGFDSGPLKQGQSFSHKFSNAGSFNYICTFHPSMKGIINVTN